MSETPFGEMSIDEFIAIATFDPITHAWDLAQAVGVDAALDEGLVARVFDGDDLHSAANRAWMASGTPLDDAHRSRWIERLRAGSIVECRVIPVPETDRRRTLS